ncbi:MAG: choice-of-anchor tandem repeat GloVer-containing protein [Bacteroidota bacterium]
MRKKIFLLRIAILLLLVDAITCKDLSAQVLWGMTPTGGSNNLGNIFSLRTDGTNFTERYAFSSFGQSPDGQKMLDYGDGFFYSVAVMPYGGIIYRMHPDGSSYQIIYQFPNVIPYAGLVKGPDGYLYGTARTTSGTTSNGLLYKIGNFGTGYQELHIFSGADGRAPSGNLLYYNGSFYGITYNGGTSDNGVLYTIKPDGTGFSVMFQFNFANGRIPTGPLVVIPSIQGSYFYGTCQEGGNNGYGTLFRIGTNGSNYQVLYNFVSTMGRPTGSLLRYGSLLYGTTKNNDANGGVIYFYNVASASVSVIHSFSSVINSTAEYNPNGSLLNINNVLYGSTENGGNNNNGVLFKINMDGTLYHVIRQQDERNGAEASLIYFNSQLYGTTTGSANLLTNGSIYRLNTDGSNYQPVHSLGGANGYTPAGSLIYGNDSSLYGMTTSGGSMYNTGLAFRMKTNGTSYQSLAWVNEGSPPFNNPHGSLVQAKDGSFYTMIPGSSPEPIEVLKVSTSPAISSHNYFLCAGPNCPSQPVASFIQGKDDYLYGMSPNPNQPSNFGSIFKVTTDGTGYQLLHTFTGPDGATPLGSLIQGSDLLLYGMTQKGGVADKGVIFQMKAAGTGYTIIHDFGTDSQEFYGINPVGSLLEGMDGYLYGTTAGVSTVGLGTIFKIKKDGTGISRVVRFNGTNGAYPKGTLVQDKKSGNLYGMTYQGGTTDFGTVFSVRPDGTGFATLVNFNGTNGKWPVGDLLLLSAGGVPLRQANEENNPAVAIENTNDNNGLSIAPNPVHNRFTIYFHNSAKANIGTILADTYGKAVFQNNVTGAPVSYSRQIDMTGLPAGIYFLSAVVSNKQFTKKIIKQ